MKPILIFGAGGHGREIFALIRAINEAAHPPSDLWDITGFFDDAPLERPDQDRLQRLNAPFLGTMSSARPMSGHYYVIGIGRPTIRQEVEGRVADLSLEAAPPLVHPQAWIGPDVAIAPGSVVSFGASVTTNVTVGRHAHINRQAAIGHDCVLGDYVIVAPMAAVSGGCVLEDRVDIGTGAVVLPGICIGHDAVIGAGAVVTKDVAPGATVIGIPARPRS
jgi:sugar O-acyltransferase (sialic acid O-acetyltransferase NeuD family)